MGLMSVFLWMVSMKQHSKKREVCLGVVLLPLVFVCLFVYMVGCLLGLGDECDDED